MMSMVTLWGERHLPDTWTVSRLLDAFSYQHFIARLSFGYQFSFVNLTPFHGTRAPLQLWIRS